MRLLELPAVTTQLCFSFLSPSDVVSVGLTCRSSAFFLFCETYFEWAAPDGDSPAAPAPPRLDSDTIPSLFGDKPVISRREDIPECVKECWKVWRAVCEARGFEPEPHRSPYVVCKSRMAAEANFRRGAYK